MGDLLIILKGTIKIIKNFFPVFLFTVIGLAYIGWDEKGAGQEIKPMKMRINTIPTCPLCKEKRSVGAINSLIGHKVKRMYFCTNCMVEFNLAGTLFPPIVEEKRTY